MHHQKMGHLCSTQHTIKQSYTTDTHIHFLPTHGSASQYTHQQKMDIFAAHSTVISAYACKGKTQAHLCTPCRKMGHLDKTHTTQKWDIFVVCCTQSNKQTHTTHIHSLPTHGSTSQHTHQHKMDIFSICSTVKNARTQR